MRGQMGARRNLQWCVCVCVCKIFLPSLRGCLCGVGGCEHGETYTSPAYPTPSLPFTFPHRLPYSPTSRTLPQRARGQPLSAQTFEQPQGACVRACREATSLRPASPAPSPRPRVRAVARCRLSCFKDIRFHFSGSTQWRLREASQRAASGAAPDAEGGAPAPRCGAACGRGRRAGRWQRDTR